MNPDAPDAARYTDLRDYLRVLRAQRWVILVIALAAGGTALFLSSRQNSVYQSGSTIAFQDETRDLSLLGTSVAPNSSPAQTPQARAQTIDEPGVLRRVQRRVRQRPSIEALRGAISTSVDPKSNLVLVTARWSNATFAANLANVFAGEAAASVNEASRARFVQAARVLRRRLRTLKDTPRNLAVRGVLADQLTRVEFLGTSSRPATVVKEARRSNVPVSPRPVRNTVLGLLLGLVLGLVVAFLRDSLDRRLRGAEAIRQELGLPLIGQVREEAMGRALQAGAKDSAIDVEGFRIMRRNLEFLSDDQPPRSVLVTSALPEEGKSTVAASLALAVAASGRSTLLVECDLRRPALAPRLEIDPSPGLVDYLKGGAGPEEILQTVALAAHGHEGDDPLVCITAGTLSPEPAETLGSLRFAEFLRQVEEAYDFVVLDTAPLLPVADTLELLPLIDAVVLCVRSSQTTREQARRAKEALDFFPDRPTGVVVTGLRARDEDAYGAYYSYGYGYTAKAG